MIDTGILLIRVVVGLYVAGHGNANGGYELAATNLSAALAVALIGVGRFSVDAWLGVQVPGLVSEVFGLLVVIGVLAAGFGRRLQPSHA
jgi:hypothetical protein